jgi:hypothetical protein
MKASDLAPPSLESSTAIRKTAQLRRWPFPLQRMLNMLGNDRRLDSCHATLAMRAGVAVATVKRAMRMRPKTGGIGLVDDRKQPDARKSDGVTDDEQAGIEERGLSWQDELLAIDRHPREAQPQSRLRLLRSATAEEATIVILRDEIAHPGIPGAALDGSHRLKA